MSFYQILDKYSPATAITEDSRKASPWFQKWLSGLQDAIDPYWQTFAPVATNATVTSAPGVQWRDRGKTFDVVLDMTVTIPSGVNLITLVSPVQAAAFGCIAGAITTDYTNYKMINVLFANVIPQALYMRMYDGNNFNPGFANITVSGFFQKR